MRLARWRVLLLGATGLLLPACLEDQGVSGEGLAAPSGLVAEVLPESSAIQLTWIDGSSSETSFRLDVADVPILTDGDVDEWTLVPANVTTYTYAAPPNATRFFRVLAVTSLHQSAPSNLASATTPDVPLAPARVDALVGPSGSDRDVYVLWDDTANETGYQIERSIDGTNWIHIATLGQNASSYLDQAAGYNGRYLYRVRGTNSNGVGVWGLSPRTTTRNTSWDRVSSSAFGDVSWNLSMAVFYNAFLAAYDASNGDLVVGIGAIGSSGLSTSTVNPGFPETFGLSGTSVSIDSSEVRHYAVVDAYSGTLYHLWDYYGTWYNEVLDSALAGDRALIKIGPDDTVHVVYQHDAGGYSALRHSWSTGSGWSYEWLDPGVPASEHLACAIDGEGGLHVAYRRPLGSGASELRYLFKPAGGSVSAMVVPTSAAPEMCSIAAGVSGVVYVSYNSLTTGALHLATRSKGGWTHEVIQQSPRTSWGRYNSVAYAPGTGELHASFIDNVYGTVHYACKPAGGSWDVHLVDRANGNGRGTVIALDVLGNIFLAYGDATAGQMKLAMSALRQPGNLLCTPVSTSQILLSWADVPNETGYRVERSLDGGATWIAIDTTGESVVSYQDSGLSSSQEYHYRVVAVNAYGESYPSNVDFALPVFRAVPPFASSSDYGSYTGIFATSAGELHVAHYDATNSNVLYTKGTAGGAFTTITANSGPAASSIVGYSGNGIVREDTGEVRIVSPHLSVGDLHYTSIVNGTPSTVTLESSGSLGYEPALVRAPDGTLHIVHREAILGGHRLRYGVRTSGAWSFNYATASEIIVSRFSNQLAVGSDGRSHLVYIYYPVSGQPSQFKYGSRSSGVWSFSTLLDAGTSISSPAVAVDQAGHPHVTYVGVPPGGAYSVMHGTTASGSWVFESIPGPTSISAYGAPASVIDPGNGRMHVAYGTYAELRYARKDPGGSWVNRRLDKGAAFGHVSISVDGAGMVHIAYRNESTKRLNVVSGMP